MDPIRGRAYLFWELPVGSTEFERANVRARRAELPAEVTDGFEIEAHYSMRRIADPRPVAGARLSEAQRAERSATNDGQQVAIESWNPFKAVGRALKAVGEAIIGAGRELAASVWDTGVGIARDLFESSKGILYGLGKIVTGRFREGLQEVGRGLLHAFVQTPIDAILMGGGKLVAAVQTLTGIEPPGRKLTSEEMAVLRRIYGDSIDYDAVRIKEGDAGLFSLNDRSFVLGNTVYLKGSHDMQTLVHEMAHVWQHQNGGTDYLSEALWSQQYGKGYEWQRSVPQTPWAELEPEQQAQLIEDLYLSGYFSPTRSSQRRFTYDVDGDGEREDLTAYAERALLELRAGRGAP